MSTMAVMGVDGFRDGWIAAEYDGDGLRWHIFRDAVSLFDARAEVTAIDIPMGLPAGDAKRACDVEAREALEPRARSSVFFTPSRDLVEAPEMRHAETIAWLRKQGLGGVSIQAHGIIKKIREVDRCLSPELQDHVLEVHPELSFRRMTTRASMASKKTAVGVSQRLRAIAAWVGVDALALLDGVPERIPVDDALDAAACAWTAERWRTKDPSLLVLPDTDQVPRDEHELLMRIVA